MSVYTDIHSHILPGVDDGSKNMEETLALLKLCYEEGTRRIFATPHYVPGHKSASPEHLRKLRTEVAEKIKETYPDMELYGGNEIYYKEGVVKDVKAGKVLTLADTDYCLVEFNTRLEYKKIFHAVKEFTEAGYRPILAHVERYDCLYQQSELIEDLIDAGAYIQINAESLLGGLFDRHSKYVQKILKDGLVHFIGSDCHRLDFRKPRMGSVFQKIKNEAVKEEIEEIMAVNVEKLLKNEWV